MLLLKDFSWFEKMKHLTLLALLVFYTPILFAQNYVWAKGEGGIGNDVANAVAVDEQGNTYVAGNLAGAADVSGTTVQGMGLYDVLIIKYNPQGNVLWIRTAGDDRNQQANALKYKNGYLYVAGIFEDTCFFGNNYIVAKGDADVFIAKYDASGNFIWAKAAGGAETDYVSAIDVDDNGNVYIGGNYEYSATFDTTSISTTNFFNESFIAKYNPTGALQWVRSSKGSSTNQITGVAYDHSSGLYFTGFFGGNYSMSDAAVSSSTSSYDILIGRLDLNGTVQWLKKAGSTYEDAAYAMCADADGNAFIAGYFAGTATFGTNTISYKNYNDIFVAKYDSTGNNEWVRAGKGQELDVAYGIACDAAGNVYATGLFQDNADFDGTTVTGNYRDVFIVSYTTHGALRWITTGGAGNTDCGIGIAVKNNDHVVIAGYYLYTCTFGTTTLPYADGNDLMVAEYSPPFLSSLSAADFREFSIYPNPAKGVCNTSLPDNTPVDIYSAQGTWIGQATVLNTAISFTQLSTGIYFLQIEGTVQTAQKLVIY